MSRAVALAAVGAAWMLFVAWLARTGPAPAGIPDDPDRTEVIDLIPGLEVPQ